MKMFRRSSTTRKRKSKRWLLLSKRKKFVLISLILSIGVLFIQSSGEANRYAYVGILTLVALVLSAWALREDIRKVGWLMAIILPVFFTVSVNLFYFLLPVNYGASGDEAIVRVWVVRMILVGVYAGGMYALLLTENIFAVASQRTIQLFRAAQALGFVFTLLVAFLLFDTVYSFRVEPWFNGLFVFALSFPILLQAVWSCKLEDHLSRETLGYTFALSWLMGWLAFFVSFWPVTIIMASLFLVSMLYVGLGLVQQAVIGRLFKKTVYEYLRVGVVVLLIVFFAASWGG